MLKFYQLTLNTRKKKMKKKAQEKKRMEKIHGLESRIKGRG